jgi:hypothetical protein
MSTHGSLSCPARVACHEPTIHYAAIGGCVVRSPHAGERMDRAQEQETDVERRADALAARVGGAEPFADALRSADAEYRELLNAVARLGPAYAFDREGRPAAIAAVREALPVMERDLFDAILDDLACERAAIEEALYRVARAYSRRQRPDP